MASLIEILSGDQAAADDIVRHGPGSGDSQSDKFFWAWMSARLSSTPVGIACLSHGAIVAGSHAGEAERAVLAGELLRNIVAGCEVVGSDTCGVLPVPDPGQGEVGTPEPGRDGAVEQLSRLVGKFFEAPLLKENGRLYSLPNGEKVRLNVSKPHRVSGEAYLHVKPQHLSADWLVVAVRGSNQGWIVPMSRVRSFLDGQRLHNRVDGKPGWNIHLASKDGSDRLWAKSASTLLIQKYRRRFDEVIGE